MNDNVRDDDVSNVAQGQLSLLLDAVDARNQGQNSIQHQPTPQHQSSQPPSDSIASVAGLNRQLYGGQVPYLGNTASFVPATAQLGGGNITGADALGQADLNALLLHQRRLQQSQNDQALATAALLYGQQNVSAQQQQQQEMRQLQLQVQEDQVRQQLNLYMQMQGYQQQLNSLKNLQQQTQQHAPQQHMQQRSLFGQLDPAIQNGAGSLLNRGPGVGANHHLSLEGMNDQVFRQQRVNINNNKDNDMDYGLDGNKYGTCTNVNSAGNRQITILVPCRARGMPVEHNPKTAHFRISEDMKHGTELVCSFPACRKAGIKFCYCAFCQTPVAKRNFRKRHMHDDAETNNSTVTSRDGNAVKRKSSDTTDEELESEKSSLPPSGAPSNSSNGMRSMILPVKNSIRVAAVVEQSRKRKAVNEDPSEISNDNSKSSNHELVEKDSKKPNLPLTSFGNLSKICGNMHMKESTLREWIELLFIRPPTDENDSMSNWLLRIISTASEANSGEPQNSKENVNAIKSEAI